MSFEQPIPQGDAVVQAETYRASLFDRIKGTNEALKPARMQILARLKNSPLFVLMQEIHKNSENAGEHVIPIDNTEAHKSLTAPSRKRYQGMLTETYDQLDRVFEDEELWNELKSEYTPELVRASIEESLAETGETDQEQQQQWQRDVEASGLTYSEAMAERDSYLQSEDVKLLKLLELLHFLTYDNRRKLIILKENEYMFANDVRAQILDIKSTPGRTIFDDLFNKLSIKENRLVDGLTSMVQQVKECLFQLERKVEVAAGGARYKSSPEMDTEKSFRNICQNKILQTIYEGAPENPLEFASTLPSVIDTLNKQINLAKTLKQAHQDISGSAKFLENLASKSTEAEENIENVLLELKNAIQRLPEIDIELDQLASVAVSTAMEASGKVARRKKLEAEKQQLQELIEKNQTGLPNLYDLYADDVSKEAVVRTIVQDEAQLKNISQKYNDIAQDVFGVGVDKLDSIIRINEEVVRELEKKVVELFNGVLEANTQDGGDAVCDQEALAQFLEDGGRALVLSSDLKVELEHLRQPSYSDQRNSTSRSVDSVINTFKLYASNYSLPDLTQKYGLPAALILRIVLQRYNQRNYETGEISLWIPVPKDIEIKDLNNAAILYADKSRATSSNKYHAYYDDPKWGSGSLTLSSSIQEKQ